MSDLLEEVREEVGAQNSDKFISFLSRRGQGDTREEVARELEVSPRTLYNWNKALMEIPRRKRLKVLIEAIIEDEDLETEGWIE